jgi:hypothetical protein
VESRWAVPDRPGWVQLIATVLGQKYDPTALTTSVPTTISWKTTWHSQERYDASMTGWICPKIGVTAQMTNNVVGFLRELVFKRKEKKKKTFIELTTWTIQAAAIL